MCHIKTVAAAIVAAITFPVSVFCDTPGAVVEKGTEEHRVIASYVERTRHWRARDYTIVYYREKGGLRSFIVVKRNDDIGKDIVGGGASFVVEYDFRRHYLVRELRMQ